MRERLETETYIEIDQETYNFLQQLYGRVQALVELTKANNYMSDRDILMVLGYWGKEEEQEYERARESNVD